MKTRQGSEVIRQLRRARAQKSLGAASAIVPWGWTRHWPTLTKLGHPAMLVIALGKFHDALDKLDKAAHNCGNALLAHAGVALANALHGSATRSLPHTSAFLLCLPIVKLF